MTQEIDIVQKEAFEVLKKDMLELLKKNEISDKLDRCLGLPEVFSEDWHENKKVEFFSKLHHVDTFTEELQICLEYSNTFNKFMWHCAMALKFKDKIIGEMKGVLERGPSTFLKLLISQLK